MHHAMSQSSMPAWLHTFVSVCLSGRGYSPGTASSLADAQRLTGSLVDPEGQPGPDHSSIPSDSFHGAHVECTTVAWGQELTTPPWGHRAFYIRDPDGNLLNLHMTVEEERC